MQVSIVKQRRKFYLVLSYQHDKVYTSASMRIPDGEMETAQAYAASQNLTVLEGEFLGSVLNAIHQLNQAHRDSLIKADMRQIDVVALKPRLISTAPTPINERFYWRRMSTVGKQTYGSPVSVNSGSAAERKRKQEAERAKSNSQVKRDYRLTPKN